MKKSEFLDILTKKCLVLDGATGTFLQKEGMPVGVCPEKWAVENPAVISNIHASYAKAGSDIVYSCTFGANRLKLQTYGLEKEVHQLNKRLVELAKEAVGKDVYVAGSIGSMGKFINPIGPLSFKEGYDIFSEQIKGMLAGGVDLLVIETMMDIQEARVALLAAKDLCDIPVMLSLTYSDENRTLTGTDPVTALITLQSLGADAVGTNCSCGPDMMLEILKQQAPYACVPLFAKPNAGLPILKDGKTHFNMSSEEFAGYVPDFIDAGVNIMGGCCGTTPEFIKKIKDIFVSQNPSKIAKQNIQAVSSRSKTFFFDKNKPVAIIGERINPTGKKLLSKELSEGKMTELKRFAVEQANAQTSILDVNVGAPDVDELNTMREAIFTLTGITDLPLCIDSSSPEVIEEALKHYPGRALVNSLSGEKDKQKKLVPLMKKYGAMFIFLPLDDSGVPELADERIKIINESVDLFKDAGIPASNMIVDGLTMTVSSSPDAPKETLKTIEYCVEQLGLLTTIGLSNISFGLPERKWINNAFMAMAISKGLGSLIINPCSEQTMNMFFSSCVLVGRDKNALDYINNVQKIDSKEKKPASEMSCSDCLINGDKENLLVQLKKEIKQGADPLKMVNESLIPAMQEVGGRFNRREFFLPQLMLSAEAMQDAFEYLKPYLAEKGLSSKGKMILATVKGDIHDIGKNIVALMLRNHGIEVIDLGKDVDTETILDTAERENVSVIGLSALMTTTMTEMENIIIKAREMGKKYKFVVGGAVITSDYANKIGAHGYAKDSVEAVELVKKLL